MSKAFLCLLLFLPALGACADSASEPGPGGISAEDAKALDDAAEKLGAEVANSLE